MYSHIHYILFQKFSLALYTVYNRIALKTHGVKLGPSCKFNGRIFVRKYPESNITIGKNCKFLSRKNSNLIGINHNCIISTSQRGAIIEIGDNCGFSGTVIGCFNKITIANNVRCGANTVITDSDWHQNDRRVGDPMPIHISENAWLGLNVVVLKGVSIGENSIIGANSVVVKDIPPNVVAAGNPCKIIKNL